MAIVIPFPQLKEIVNPCQWVAGHEDPTLVCLACEDMRICRFFGKKTVRIPVADSSRDLGQAGAAVTNREGSAGRDDDAAGAGVRAPRPLGRPR